MATKIKLLNGSQPPIEKSVTEEAENVAGRVNAAVANDHKFIVLTDQESGKQLSIDPRRVTSFEES